MNLKNVRKKINLKICRITILLNLYGANLELNTHSI